MKKLVQIILVVLAVLLCPRAAQMEDVLMLPQGLTSIEAEAFCQIAVNRAVLPEGISSIGSRAFADSSLSAVNLPSSLTFIADDAFSGCRSLEVGVKEGTYAYEWAVGNGLSIVVLPALDAPTVSAVNVESTGKIRVSWNAVKGAVSYKVMRSESEKGTYTRVMTTEETTFVNTSVEAGSTYYYYVVAVDGDGKESLKSNIVSCAGMLPRPSVSLSSVAETGKIRLEWTAVDGAQTYEVSRSLDGTVFTVLGTTADVSMTDESAQAVKTYYYRVRALAQKGTVSSAYSAVKNRMCDLAQPKLTLTQADNGTIRLSWSAVDGASEYRVYRSTAQDDGFARLKITADTSCVDYEAMAGTTHYYKVIAYAPDTDANSAYSQVCSAVCSGMNLYAELNGNGKPYLRWNAVQGAASYDIYRKTGESGTFKRIYTASGTTMTNSGAAAGVTYSYKVSALDANGKVIRESDNTVSITTAIGEEALDMVYLAVPWKKIYAQPDDESQSILISYMTQVQLGAAVTSGDAGSWRRLFYRGELYYVWIEADDQPFADEKRDFVYTCSNVYQQKVVDLAVDIALNWKTVYEHYASKGEQKEDGTYGFNCSGLVRYVMNTVMQQYVPTYKVVAEIEDLVVTQGIYNAGYPGEFAAYEVELNEIQPGDVVFFSQQAPNDHCGIYLGNGEFAHSSNSEYLDSSVCIMPLADQYLDQISVIRRYLPEKVTPAKAQKSVITSNCKLYKERSTEAEQLYVFKIGEPVTVLFTNNDNWAYVQMEDGTLGFMLLRNLGETAPEDDADIAVTISNVESTGKIKLTWEAVDGAAIYHVMRCESRNGTYTRAGKTESTAFTNTSVNVGSRYYYYVVALGENDEVLAVSNTLSGLCVLPRPVLTLSGVQKTGKIRLDWEAVEGASGYEVCRSLDEVTWNTLATTADVGMTDENAQPEKLYFYKVKALASDTQLDSAYSAVKSWMCDLAQPKLTLTQADNGTIHLSWSAVDGVSEYRIYRSTSQDSGFKWIKITTERAYTDYVAEVGTKYYYKVIAYALDTDANSAYSQVYSAVCPKMNLYAELDENGKPSLRYNAVSGAANYGVYRSKSADSGFKQIYTTAGTMTTNSGASAGTTYYYKVCALDANGNVICESDNTACITTAQ